MYTAFYGFRERPFDLTPSPRFLYMSGKHREALSNIHYGIFGSKGITLLVGEAGTGKTTLVKAALAKANESDACCVSLSNPTLTRAEFFEFLAAGFGLSLGAGQSKARFLLELQRLVATRQRAGHATALIVDEAQSLPLDLMEEVRLLANVETDSDRPFPVVLVGQPQLATCLEQPEAATAETTGGAALRSWRPGPARDGRLHRRQDSHRGRRRRERVHPRRDGGDLRTVGRHSTDDQRHLRQRAGQRVRGRHEADWPRHRAGGVP